MLEHCYPRTGGHRAPPAGTPSPHGRPAQRRGRDGRADPARGVPLRPERQGAGLQHVAAVAGQRQPEHRTLAGLAPRLQPAAVQAGVLDGDGQPQPGAAGAPRPRLLGPPEAVEHQARLPRSQADTVVADHDRDGVLVGPERHPHRLGLAVVDRVGHQVAHDPLDASGVDVGPHSGRQIQLQRRAQLVGQPAHGLDRPRDHPVHVDALGAQLGDPRVEPGDLQQVAEQRLEPVQLRDEQLRAAPQRGQQLVAGGVEDVGGHPDGGERRPQLVADVGGEPPLQRAELLQLPDLLLDAARHLVVRLAEPGQLVLALHGEALVEVAVGEPLGDLRGPPHRPHDLPRDDHGDARQQEQQHEPADDQRALDEPERALLRVEREQQVELQVAVRGAHRLADHQRGDVDALRLDRAVAHGPGPVGDALPQVGRHVLQRARGHARGGADRGGGEHRAERARGGGARRVGGVREPVEGVVELALRAFAVGVDARQLAFQQRRAGLDLVLGVVQLGLQDVARDLGLDDEAEHQYDRGRQRQRADHHAQLQRAAPHRAPRDRQLRPELAHLVDGAPDHGDITAARLCTPPRARSARPPGAPGRARPSTAAAGRARSPAACRPRGGIPTPARAAPPE